MHLDLLRSISVGVVLGLAAAIDCRDHRIPDGLVACGLAASIALSHNLIMSLAGGVCGLALFWIVRVISQHGVGLGDVKYAAYLGTVLGPREWWRAVLVASFTALLFAVARGVRQRESIRSALPFAPFLSAGCLTSQLFDLLPSIEAGAGSP